MTAELQTTTATRRGGGEHKARGNVGREGEGVKALCLQGLNWKDNERTLGIFLHRNKRMKVWRMSEMFKQKRGFLVHRGFPARRVGG